MLFKPGARLVYQNYFRKSVCLYQSTYLYVRTNPREQTTLVAKATLIQEI